MPRMVGLGLIVALLAAGCSFSASREAAEETMADYFAAIERRDYAAAMDVYADSFFKDVSREAWEARLAGTTRRFGDLQSYAAVSWNVKKSVGADGGTFVQVVYQTRYARRPAVEQFILKKADGDFRIIAHRIDARDLPQGKTQFV